MKEKPSFLNILNRFEYQFILSDEKAEEPIRSEIFSVERLKQHAESLAVAQTVTSDPRKGYNLSKRLKNNKKILFDCLLYKPKCQSYKNKLSPDFHIPKPILWFSLRVISLVFI